MKASSHPGSPAFVCMDWRHLAELLAARVASLDMLNLCVWTKPNAGMGSLYRSQHELVFVFKLGPGRHRNNVQLGAYGRNRSNVWPYAAGPGFGRAGEEGRLAALHPTVKPTAMIADAILDVTRRGDIVLDPFLGSGATLMACERTGRRCCGIELDPLYCDVIVRRWQAYTGGAARLATTGEAAAAARGGSRRAGGLRHEPARTNSGILSKPPGVSASATVGRRWDTISPRPVRQPARPTQGRAQPQHDRRRGFERTGRGERERPPAITKLEAAVKQLVNRAASGEARATQLLLALVQANEARRSAGRQSARRSRRHRHGRVGAPVGGARIMTLFSLAEYQAALRADFHSFMVRCFVELNSGASFLPSWHIEVMAAKLRRFATGASGDSSSTSRLAI